MTRAKGPVRARLRRLGLFGGTFDPPHLGHLVIAERAREQLGLDRVVFMPSGTPPHKRGRAVAPAADRLAMTRLAVGGNPGFAVSTLEIRRRGASYTVETLRTLAAAHPGARLFLVIGEDSLEDFPSWHEPRAILELATLAVAPRTLPRSRRRTRPPLRPRGLAPSVIWLGTPALAISSSDIREEVRAGRSVRYLVPERVRAYSERRGFYRRAR